MKTFTESVEEFKKSWADKLKPEDAPMWTSLEQAAAELDRQATGNGVQAALLNTFGVTYRTLLKKAGVEGMPSEEEEFLDSL